LKEKVAPILRACGPISLMVIRSDGHFRSPYQRTFSVAAGMSQMCQQATSERKKGLLSRRP